MLKRYQAIADTTITNAYKSNLSTRATGSNMGQADVLEVFSIYGQASSASVEQEKILIKFPILTTMATDYSSNVFSTGSASYYLKLYNAKHSETLPKNYSLKVSRVSGSWDEGFGLDMDNYSDLGYCNWVSSSSGSAWSTEGGDSYASPTASQYFDIGTEDLEIEITSLVNECLASSSDNGFMIELSAANLADTRSFYTKKFFARGSEFYFDRPVLEVRWNDVKNDDRNNFFLSSSFLTSVENLNDLYLYNYRNGQLRNIPALGANQTTSTKVYVQLFGSLGSTSSIALPIGGGVSTNNDYVITGSWVATGVYKASVAFTASNSTIYDVWSTSSVISSSVFTTQLHSGSAITVQEFDPNRQVGNYLLSMPGLQKEYSPDGNQLFNLYMRQRNWTPTVYTVSSTEIEKEYLDNVFYKVVREVDNRIVVNYGTGSESHTKVSYDTSGHYFKFDCSMLEPGYLYSFQYLLYDGLNKTELPYKFKFKVKE